MAVPNIAQLSEIFQWLETVITGKWGELIILPLGYAIFRFIEYWVKLKIERKPETEKIEQYEKLADLQKKLEENNMSISDLNLLRKQVLGEEAENAITVATQYADVAKQLVMDVEVIDQHSTHIKESSSANLDRTLTQFDMNMLSAQKAREADRELMTLLVDLMQQLPPDGAALLQKAQDQWQAFRQVEAEREAKAWEGGSIMPLMINARLEALTRERIASLKRDASLDGSKSELSKTPPDLLQNLEKGVPKARVSHLLGTPTYIHGNIWLYRYEETQVEITFDKHESIADVVVALCHEKIYAGYNPITDIPLGKLTLADILEIDSQLVLQHRWSMRTEEIFIQVRIGPAGAWEEYFFGALSVYSGVGNLHDVLFDWDRENEKLITNPKDVLINWVGISSSSMEAPHFSWFIK